jgi:hypothetical protein
MKRSPIKPKRETPRRDEGRITHGRIKRKATGKSAEEARHIERVAQMGCLVCGAPAQVHHVTSDGTKREGRRHDRVVPLCREHHTGNRGVHTVGPLTFNQRLGYNLMDRAAELWETSQRGS